jgi:hypothetical protein
LIQFPKSPKSQHENTLKIQFLFPFIKFLLLSGNFSATKHLKIN